MRSKKVILSEVSKQDIIRNAISNRTLAAAYYRGASPGGTGPRLVQPVEFQSTDEGLAVLVWEFDGASHSSAIGRSTIPGWRTLIIDRIYKWEAIRDNEGLQAPEREEQSPEGQQEPQEEPQGEPEQSPNPDDVVAEFFDKFAYRFKRGYPDFNDPDDLATVSIIFEELGIHEGEDTVDFDIDLKDNPTVFARYKGRVVGRLRLITYEDGYQIDSILVMDDFKGYGIGKNLILFGVYELNKPIYSDKTHSKEASYVWQSLIKTGDAEETSDGRYVAR